jgi:cytochrome c oxidase assembly protein subunit 15
VPDFARFYRFTVVVLIFTLAVIVWGGYVRASGAGAGCGSHWPDCNGEIVPRSPGSKTLIEFTHRTTSGLSFLLIAVQMIWAWRISPRGHGVRRMATVVFGLIISEALVGAGIVIFKKVAGDESTDRAYWMAAHLMNTFALLAAMAILIQRVQRELRPGTVVVTAEVLPGARGLQRALTVGVVAVVLIAVSGAIVALGDTLFPAHSLAHGWEQDLSPSAHLFVRLRIYHPIFALTGGLYLLVVSAIIVSRDSGAGRVRSCATRLAAIVLVQLVAGALNLVLLAPVAMQLLHLLLADLVWLSLVVLTAVVAQSVREGRRVSSGDLAAAAAV